MDGGPFSSLNWRLGANGGNKSVTKNLQPSILDKKIKKLPHLFNKM